MCHLRVLCAFHTHSHFPPVTTFASEKRREDDAAAQVPVGGAAGGARSLGRHGVHHYGDDHCLVAGARVRRVHARVLRRVLHAPRLRQCCVPQARGEQGARVRDHHGQSHPEAAADPQDTERQGRHGPHARVVLHGGAVVRVEHGVQRAARLSREHVGRKPRHPRAERNPRAPALDVLHAQDRVRDALRSARALCGAHGGHVAHAARVPVGSRVRRHPSQHHCAHPPDYLELQAGPHRSARVCDAAVELWRWSRAPFHDTPGNWRLCAASWLWRRKSPQRHAGAASFDLLERHEQGACQGGQEEGRVSCVLFVLANIRRAISPRVGGHMRLPQ